VSLPDAAALVVGQNVGTTVKAAVASLGASVPARRTALAHILFNLATGAVAFAMLPLLLRASLLAAGGEEAVALAAFHTAFNLLGVALFLPWLRSFARLVERLVPESGPALARHLDPSVASVGPVAIEAARRTLAEVTGVTVSAVRLRLGARHEEAVEALVAARSALADVRTFLASVRSEPDSPGLYGRHVAALHGLDHLERLVDACTEEVDPAAVSELMAGPARDLPGALRLAESWAREGGEVHALAELSATIAAARRGQRAETLARTASGALDPRTALVRIEAMRWLDRLAYHLWRTLHHLEGGADGPGAPGDPDDR
jgi:phosphate:Na+ symporter